LRDLEQCTADLIPVADADGVVGQSLDREVFAELSVDEVGPLQLLLPIAIRLDLVDENGALLASVPGQVALTVSSRFNRPTRQRPCTGLFQMPGCTVRPFHSMSRGSPTFTDRSRAMALRLAWAGSLLSSWLFAGHGLRHGKLAIGTVRNHCLTRLVTERGAIDLYGDHVRLE
jgi:hypothetical protein